MKTMLGKRGKLRKFWTTAFGRASRMQSYSRVLCRVDRVGSLMRGAS